MGTPWAGGSPIIAFQETKAVRYGATGTFSQQNFKCELGKNTTLPAHTVN